MGNGAINWNLKDKGILMDRLAMMPFYKSDGHYANS